DQRAVGGDGPVGADVQATGGLRVLVVDAGGADGDQADPAGRARGEVGPGPLRGQALGGAVQRLHRRHDQPVAQLHRADPAGREQVREPSGSRVLDHGRSLAQRTTLPQVSMDFAVVTAYLPLEEILPIAQAADRLGYRSLTVADHVVDLEQLSTPYPYEASGERRWSHDV